MARDFDGTADMLRLDSGIVTAWGFSVAAWIRDGFGIAQGAYQFFGSGTSVANYPYIQIGTVGIGSDQRGVRLQVHNGVVQDAVTGSDNVADDAWHHTLGVFGADTRSVYTDGNKATTSSTLGALDGVRPLTQLSIGALLRTVPLYYFDGAIAAVAVWLAELTDAEAVALAAGVSPLTVRPAALLAYWPLADAGYRDVVGGRVLTPAGAPSLVDGPAVYSPAGVIVGKTMATAGPTLLGFERGRRGVGRGMRRGVA